MILNRRDFLKWAALAAGMGCGLPACGQTPHALAATTSLNQLALQSGRLFGASFDIDALNDPAYAALYHQHCGILTTDYNLKFWSLRPHPGAADFRKADRLIAFAQQAGIPVRGHTLIWNEWNPKWVHALSRQEVAYWMERHIDETVSRYAGKMHSWDVVNEPFWPDHYAWGGYRKGVWYKALGPDYIGRAFKAAALADPHAKLVLNEAWVERNTPMAAVVRHGLLNTLRQLLDQGVKIDAIGLQCHLRPDRTLSLNVLSEFLDKLNAFPLEVYITELDVGDHDLRTAHVDGDAAVQQIYQQFANCVLAHANVKAIICWQLADRYSYLVKEGRARTPLPFDRDFLPNPGYWGLRRAFLDARKRI